MENNNQPKPVEELSYNEALTELEAIVNRLRSDNCDIDRLTVMTSRATELLEYCRNRLTTTEDKLQAILEKLT